MVLRGNRSCRAGCVVAGVDVVAAGSREETVVTSGHRSPQRILLVGGESCPLWRLGRCAVKVAKMGFCVVVDWTWTVNECESAECGYCWRQKRLWTADYYLNYRLLS